MSLILISEITGAFRENSKELFKKSLKDFAVNSM